MGYTRLHPDFWECFFNFQAIASVVSSAPNEMICAGNFRTYGDYIGIAFSSYDDENKLVGNKNHKYLQYPTNLNYSGVKFRFTPSYTGDVCTFGDIEKIPSVTIQYSNGAEEYIALGFMSSTTSDSITISNFQGGESLGHNWIEWGSITGTYTWIEEIPPIPPETEPTLVKHVETLVEGDTHEVDYVHGIIYGGGGGYPLGGVMKIAFNYHNQQTYEIDFDNMKTGTHPYWSSTLSSNNITRIMIGIIHNDYVKDDMRCLGESKEFSVTFGDIVITNGDLGGSIPTDKPKSYLSIAENYDNETSRNPVRLIKDMYKLGYTGRLNLYIGTSHFYDKKGELNGPSGLGDMYLDPTKTINKGFKNWLKYLCKALKTIGEDIIISISMECLQMPEAWKQRMSNGEAGQTGWDPPTSFYSPCNQDVRTYWKALAKDCLQIAIDEGLDPWLQLGEPWWWFQEFMPGDINTPYPEKPPCWYDDATKASYLEEFGVPMPIYNTTQNLQKTSELEHLTGWLKNKLGAFSDVAKEAAIEKNCKYGVLFFPPSILDKDRVPWVMRECNTPFSYWKSPKLDYFQIEDYDWLVPGVEYHKDVYDFPLRYLNYTNDKVHYFSGFVWPEYGIDITLQWKRIEEAAKDANSLQFLGTYIWAGTQIRKYDWVPRDMMYKPQIVNWSHINFPTI